MFRGIYERVNTGAVLLSPCTDGSAIMHLAKQAPAMYERRPCGRLFVSRWVLGCSSGVRRTSVGWYLSGSRARFRVAWGEVVGIRPRPARLWEDATGSHCPSAFAQVIAHPLAGVSRLRHGL